MLNFFTIIQLFNNNDQILYASYNDGNYRIEGYAVPMILNNLRSNWRYMSISLFSVKQDVTALRILANCFESKVNTGHYWLWKPKVQESYSICFGGSMMKSGNV